jgi:hypothetical protein
MNDGFPSTIGLTENFEPFNRKEKSMPYTLIKGEFYIHYPWNPKQGPEPDGDTLKFRPINRRILESLPRAGSPVKITGSGIATLRLEGIDALETHFQVDSSIYHQHIGHALRARDELLAQVGFREITYYEESHLMYKVARVQNHPVRGFILSNGLDVHGRVISFCFIGDTDNLDGARVWVEPEDLDDSLNVYMLEEGHAYGAFYSSLPWDLREYLRTMVQTARDHEVGLWGEACADTAEKAVISSADDLQELVMWPKLFRRLAAYFEEGYDDLRHFESWLREDPRDRDDQMLLPNQEVGNFHDLLIVTDNSVQLRFDSDEVVVVPDELSPQSESIHPPANRHIGAGDLRIVAALVNGPGTPELETVTVINTTSVDINLNGWYLADAMRKQPLAGTIKAGDAFRVDHLRFHLNNDGDTISVLDSMEQIVDQVFYTSRDVPGEGGTLVF